MTRYEITLTAPAIGKIKHVIRASDRQAAIARVKRAHPNATQFKAARLPDLEPDYTHRAATVLTQAARDASNAAKRTRHAQHLENLRNALTPEGEGITSLADRLGVAPVSVRKWAAELEAEGVAVRERVTKQGKLIVRSVGA